MSNEDKQQQQNFHVAQSKAGFIQQLAACYIPHGYYFYFTGLIPEGKNRAAVDSKIINRYETNISRYRRCRRKKAGQANVRFLRYGRFFVICATRGKHCFFEDHDGHIKDFRTHPLYFFGHSISCTNGRATVRIQREKVAELRAYYEEIATKRPAEVLQRDLDTLPFERYKPVAWQLMGIYRMVNRKRKIAGLPRMVDGLRTRRYAVKPFERIYPVEKAG